MLHHYMTSVKYVEKLNKPRIGTTVSALLPNQIIHQIKPRFP